ncbi:shikimate kinase [Silvibacterium acidisoli]|uniref:shikimate kinase n=1 Tax=Acidobacteriaceae bacterium ZG23-2 TaxID=2883246 RepID=UPI00406C8651
MRRIVLTGFMGAGKSTVGSLLAARMGWRFLDSDTLIEEQTGMTIAGIFAAQGEASFRLAEAEAIRSTRDEDAIVLALGGGAIENEATRRILEEMPDTCIVFLDAPLEIMIDRCLKQPGAAERPVLADRERLALRFANRMPHYRKAHLTITTMGLEPDAVAETIFQTVGEQSAISSQNKDLTHR